MIVRTHGSAAASSRIACKGLHHGGQRFGNDPNGDRQYRDSGSRFVETGYGECDWHHPDRDQCAIYQWPGLYGQREPNDGQCGSRPDDL